MKFTLSMPPGINKTYGVTRKGKIPFYKKPAVRDWEYSAGWEVKRQWKGRKIAMTGNLLITIVFYYRHNRDIDAGIKVLLDLFQRMGVYKNDQQITEMAVSKEPDLERPRVEVEILPL
jgi:Holliday junction resolvase RusA-like endonuclease